MPNSPPPPQPQKSRGKRRWPIWLVLVIIAALVASGIGAVLYVASLPVVDVTAINFTSSDEACGIGGHTFPGFKAAASAAEEDTLTIPNLDFYSCTINAVGTFTTGFSISGANVPLSIPFEGSQSLSFTIQVPSSPYNGVLTIDVE